MTHKERIKLLREWEKQVCEVDTLWKSLRILFDCRPESQIFQVLYGTLIKYSHVVSALVCDGGDWLEWYHFENAMGGKQMEAKAGAWKKGRKIKSIEDLCRLIEADLCE